MSIATHLSDSVGWAMGASGSYLIAQIAAPTPTDTDPMTILLKMLIAGGGNLILCACVIYLVKENRDRRAEELAARAAADTERATRESKLTELNVANAQALQRVADVISKCQGQAK